MSSQSQSYRGPVAAALLAVLGIVCGLGTIAAAQEQPAPKWEIFGGYSFVYPHADMHGLLPGGVLQVTSGLESNAKGLGASVTYDFNRWLGLTTDISGDFGSGESGVVMRIDEAEFFNLSIGPKITFRSHYFSPFVEGLVGGHRLTSELFGHDDRIGFMAGGGIDLNLSRHFALRLIRADYVFSDHRYGPAPIVSPTDLRGLRAQSGVVFMFGGGRTEPAPLTANCSAQPNDVLVGEPVTVNAAAGHFNPKHTLTYNWSSTGGQITGKEGTASIDTNGMAGGSYSATAHISDPGVKGGEASCMAAFTVREPRKNPPTVVCSADPSTVQTGTPSTIGCTCTSADNVPVTLSGWTASGGTISGSGNSAALTTAGAPAGPITVSATCSDSRGLNTPASTQVMVENPPPPSREFLQLEARLALHSIYFPTAQPRVEPPDGGLLPSQQQTLISLASDFAKYLETKADAHLTLEGHADPRASVEYNQALSERRVERVKGFLIEHGVPAASIETKAFGDQRNLTNDQVKDAVEQNPELTPEQRQRVLSNMQTILLASNRRVDITLSTTGQRSARQYPFNAADSLTLLKQEGAKKTTKPAAKKK